MWADQCKLLHKPRENYTEDDEILKRVCSECKLVRRHTKVVKERRRLLEERKRAKEQEVYSKVIFYSVVYFSNVFHFH